MRDQFYFGENHHTKFDAFNYTFGCVERETNLFYTQKADGILGLINHQDPKVPYKPLYAAMKEQNIINNLIFTLCLGKNGGYFQIGGYDNTGHLEKKSLTWVPM